MRATIDQLKARISEKFAADATDETSSPGASAELLQEVLDEGFCRAESILAGAPAPARTMVDAELTFACFFLYARRGFAGQSNPWNDDAGAAARRLERISAGEIDPHWDPAGEEGDIAAGRPGRIMA